jgi:thymidylate synthase ThyX
MKEKALELAKKFMTTPLSFEWTELEETVVERFFTNLKERIFFIHTLPANMIAVLMAMYSRMRNPRGIRGMMVDSFLPQVLSTSIPECLEKYEGNQVKFLKENNIVNLDSFVQHSDETKASFDEFMTEIKVNPEYLKRLSQAKKMQVFLSTWLDKYGHNSIARPSMVYVCFEQISILLAKSIEWCRPGAGFIELSTRYVEMSGKGIYPIAQELAEYGVDAEHVNKVILNSFQAYRDLEGGDLSGPLPEFWRKHFATAVPDKKDLEMGVFGETCDVLGNLLPCATLTSVGVGISGESLPELMRHLQLDGTPENLAAVEHVIEEAEKIGATQFLRHFDVTEWKQAGWQYIDEIDPNLAIVPDNNFVETALYNLMKSKPKFKDCKSWAEVLVSLKKLDRSAFDKLYREFEAVTVLFAGKMTYRGWRDLHRMGLSTHRRGYLNPKNGFYKYDKAAPEILQKTFTDIHEQNQKLYDEMTNCGVPENLMEYPLALGIMIDFIMGSNLRQWEFCNWQRSKPSVNHEVRQLFLLFENRLRKAYPWWQEVSRADTTPAYTFARGSAIPLKE